MLYSYPSIWTRLLQLVFLQYFFSHWTCSARVVKTANVHGLQYLLVSILHLRSEIWTGASSAGSESSKWVRLAVRTKWLVSFAVETNMLWQLQACESQWKPILLTWVEMCLILGMPCPPPPTSCLKMASFHLLDPDHPDVTLVAWVRRFTKWYTYIYIYILDINNSQSK